MSFWKNPWQPGNRDQALEREISHHLEELIQANISQGMSADEARRQAMIEFGGREQVKLELRRVHASALVDALLFNIKAAARFVRRSPSFAIAVMLILAVGIGANSAVFSAMDAVVLRPLPFPNGDQLVAVYQHDLKNRDANHFVAPARLEDWNRMNSTFQSISGYYTDDASETSGALPEKLTAALVAPRFLQTMGVAPMLGRDFVPEEEHFKGPAVVLISYAFWQRRFHGDPGVLGYKLHNAGYSQLVVGVMPPGFIFPSRDVDLWMVSAPDAPYAQDRHNTWFTVIGRLKPGTRLQQAQADLATVQSALGKQFPNPDAELNVETTSLKEVVVGGVRDTLWLLYGSVSLLLLIACSNIAALLLARTAGREHEISIRFALGASRFDIILQLLAEVFALALGGSLLGLLLSAGTSRAFHLLADTLPRAEEITLNWRIVFYTLACAGATTIVCGLLPALRGTRRQLALSLAQTDRTQVSGQNRAQWTLVGVQVMLAVTLLSGAGLLLRSLERLSRVNPGFEPAHVLSFQITGSWGETADMKALVRRMDRTLDGLRSLPGVEAAGTAGMLPGVPNLYQVEFKIDGNLDPNRRVLADNRWVSAGYFDAMQIPLLEGETCKQGSTGRIAGADEAQGDVLVNRSFVEHYLNGSPPIGHQLSLAKDSPFPWQAAIRGVVGDAREEGMNMPAVPTVYGCLSAPSPFPYYLARTHGDPSIMAESIRRRIHELEPTRSVYGMMPLQLHLDDVSFENRLRTFLLTLFAGSAVFLAGIGLYGMLTYIGRVRRREVGLRLALGAVPGQIVRRFLLQGLRVTVLGCVAGLALSLVADRLLQGMLYGVSVADPVTYIAVLFLILSVATGAAILPAWRAARVDPMHVLRQE